MKIHLKIQGILKYKQEMGSLVSLVFSPNTGVGVLNQHVSDMLFNFNTDRSIGRYSIDTSDKSNHYNRFFNHSERQKGREGGQRKIVRFSNELSNRLEQKPVGTLVTNESKPILKK